jgi:hypothetical protein
MRKFGYSRDKRSDKDLQLLLTQSTSASHQAKWTGGDTPAAIQLVMKTFTMPLLKINSLAASKPSNSGSRVRV